jgi:hypothetical protein
VIFAATLCFYEVSRKANDDLPQILPPDPNEGAHKANGFHRMWPHA